MKRGPNNRMSAMQQRNRRTTVMSGKNINEILQERDSIFETVPGEEEGKAVIEESQEEHNNRMSISNKSELPKTFSEPPPQVYEQVQASYTEEIPVYQQPYQQTYQQPQKPDYDNMSLPSDYPPYARFKQQHDSYGQQSYQSNHLSTREAAYQQFFGAGGDFHQDFEQTQSEYLQSINEQPYDGAQQISDNQFQQQFLDSNSQYSHNQVQQQYQQFVDQPLGLQNEKINSQISTNTFEEPVQANSRGSFYPSYATPPDENNEDFFDSESSKRQRKDREADMLEALKVRKAVRSIRTNRQPVSQDILEQLVEVEAVEQELEENDFIEQNMDELLQAAESFGKERRRDAEVAEQSDESESQSEDEDEDERDTFYYNKERTSSHRRLTPTNQHIKDNNTRKNKDFSIEFEDGDLKEAMTKSLTSRNGSKMMRSFEIQESDKMGSKSGSRKGSRVHSVKSKRSNHNSLDSKEDFDNYLETLEVQVQQDQCNRYWAEEEAKALAEQKRIQELKCTCNAYSWINKRILKSKCELHEALARQTTLRRFKSGISGGTIETNENGGTSPRGDEEVEKEGEEQLFDSDESFTKEYYTIPHQGVLMKTMDDDKKRKTQRLQELTKDDWDFYNQCKVIEWNETYYQDQAIEELKKNQDMSIKKAKTSDIKMRLLTAFVPMNRINHRLKVDSDNYIPIVPAGQNANTNSDPNAVKIKITSVAISQQYIFLGNSNGELHIYHRDTEEEYGSYVDMAKDFRNNAVTCIDIHPTKSQYVVLGYQYWELVLLDIREIKKPWKIIKDHHRMSVTDVKFCDWNPKEKFKDKYDSNSTSGNQLMPAAAQQQTNGTIVVENADLDSWMFMSLDQSGKIIINTITKFLFFLQASKYVVFEPTKVAEPDYKRMFTCVSTRFASKYHGQGIYDDLAIAAIANQELVQIIEAEANKYSVLFEVKAPEKFYNSQTKLVDDIKPCNTQLAWGYGMSPVLKDRSHSILAIAWGPLIQLVVFIDNEDTDQPFILDGYYILKQGDAVISHQAAHRGRKSVRFEEAQLLDILKTVQQPGGTKVSELAAELKDADTKAFTKPEMNIVSVQWLSDSILLVVTQNNEVRVLYTQSFNPERYRYERPENKAFMKMLTKEVFPELEIGIKLPNLFKSEITHGGVTQSIKQHKGKIVAITNNIVQGIVQNASHLTWQQSIIDFSKQVDEDLKQVFSRALAIYKGKIKGYAGIPDNQYVREIQMKNELKQFVKDIIKQLIEKARNETRQVPIKSKANFQRRGVVLVETGNGQLDIDVIEERRNMKLSALIRSAIEFCMILKDSHFLFEDMYRIFQEEKIDENFFSELEVFILGGDFTDWEIPPDFIQLRLINYYKKPTRMDSFERVICNLNLKHCPKLIILEFVHFAESNYLTTALLYLYTQVFEKKDKTACIQVLFSLFDLYKKQEKNFQHYQGEDFDLRSLRDEYCPIQKKKEITTSPRYLGYKILWAIQLFLNGKKFPRGNIKETRWRTYIHDIVSFLANQDIMKVLLNIEAEAFFQVIAILFYEGKPFELFLSGRDKEEETNQPVLTLYEFIQKLDGYCLSFEATPYVKSCYLYFTANVIAKNPLIEGLDNWYYYNLAREILTQFREYIEFNRNISEMSFKRRKRVQLRLEQQGIFLANSRNFDQIKHIYKAENDIINIIKKSDPLDNFQIQDLLKLAEPTQFNQVKIYLLEKKEEFIKCLNMLIQNIKLSEVLTAEQQGEEILYWIRDKIELLESKISKSIIDKNQHDMFKREVTQNIKKIVALYPMETVKLIEEKFGGIHKDMIEYLYRDPLEQMYYLDSFLILYEKQIQETITNYGTKSTNPVEAKRYIEFLKLHLNLCCQFQPEKVLTIAEKIVKNSYYPIQECLEICQKYEQIDAAFILTKKLGKYYQCVNWGLALIKEKVDLQKLKLDLYYAKKHNMTIDFNDEQVPLPQVKQLDSFLRKLFKICRKYSKEVEKEKEELIWYVVIDFLLEMRRDPNIEKKTYCNMFFQERLIIFIEEMIMNVPIKNFLDHIFLKTHDIYFKDLAEIFKDVFYKINQETIVLFNANSSIFRANQQLFQQVSTSSKNGMLCRQRICGVCKRYQDSYLYEEMQKEEDNRIEKNFFNMEDSNGQPYIYDSANELVKIFACRHTFHIRCLEKYYKEKTGNQFDFFSNRFDKQLRCPTCNIKEYDLNEAQMSKSMKPGQKGSSGLLSSLHKDGRKGTYMRGGNRPQEPEKEQSLEERIEESYAKKMQTQRMIQENLKSKALFKISKKMNYYEQHKLNTWLTVSDFKI